LDVAGDCGIPISITIDLWGKSQRAPCTCQCWGLTYFL
jgi:hypothetical protein